MGKRAYTILARIGVYIHRWKCANTTDVCEHGGNNFLQAARALRCRRIYILRQFERRRYGYYFINVQERFSRLSSNSSSKWCATNCILKNKTVWKILHGKLFSILIISAFVLLKPVPESLSVFWRKYFFFKSEIYASHRNSSRVDTLIAIVLRLWRNFCFIFSRQTSDMEKEIASREIRQEIIARSGFSYKLDRYCESKNIM